MSTQARPQASELPTIRQLRLLPLRALVGLAARCVRRARNRYTAGRIDCGDAVDDTIQAAFSFSQGEATSVPWREVKRAVLYASNADAESVAIAAEHLASAVANALIVDDQPSRAGQVLHQVAQTIEAAYDACFDEEFVDAARDEFFRLKKLSKQHRFPRVGPELDATSNGPLGPEWPIWDTRALL